jgi:hypothetical protein
MGQWFDGGRGLSRVLRPSLNTLFGITAAKKRIKKVLGITVLLKPFRFWTNQKRRIKREGGYESKAEGCSRVEC